MGGENGRKNEGIGKGRGGQLSIREAVRQLITNVQSIQTLSLSTSKLPEFPGLSEGCRPVKVRGVPTTLGEFSTEEDGDPCELAGDDESVSCQKIIY